MACNGTTLPYNDPWWADHTPPLHPNCGCYVLAIPTPKYPNYAGPPVTVTPGWGTGVVPLSAADEAVVFGVGIDRLVGDNLNVLGFLRHLNAA